MNHYSRHEAKKRRLAEETWAANRHHRIYVDQEPGASAIHHELTTTLKDAASSLQDERG
jgi:hypothetical protein